MANDFNFTLRFPGGLFCPSLEVKKQQSLTMRRFYRAAAKLLPGGYTITSKFNPGGPAVWGETHGKISFQGKPIVESYDTANGILVRQWDGRNSGRNYYVKDLDSFVPLVLQLSSRPFERF